MVVAVTATGSFVDLDLDPEAIDDYADWLNQQIADDLRLTGDAFVTTTEVQDQTVIRLSICSHRTTPADIDRTFDAILDHGDRIDDEHRDRLRTMQTAE